MALFLAVCGITAVVTWLLVTETNSKNADDAKIATVKISAIRTGLSVGAGAGGAMALLLASRKQWLGERAQSHQEEVAANGIMDATERRVTDLYGKALDQLGSEKAAVRIGGIFALERLAQANPSHRQTITDVICAYLRMPFPVPATVDLRIVTAQTFQAALATDTDRQEMQVRLTAQDLLRRHLSKAARDKGEFWEGLRIDLSGALLVTFNLSNCEIGRGVFTNTRFVGTTRFATSKSIGDIIFRGSQFYGFADFSGFNFAGRARFDEANFKKACTFQEVNFDLGVRFDKAAFADQAVFKSANFHHRSVFDGVIFSGDSVFTEAEFLADAQLLQVVFAKNARFSHVRFRGAVVIAESTFEGEARFGNSQFEGRLRVKGVQFRERTTFGECTFTSGVSVRNSSFSRSLIFMNSRLMDGASFREVTFEGPAKFTGAPDSQTMNFYGSHFNNSVEFHRVSEFSFKFDKSSVLNREQVTSGPRGWIISSQASQSGRYEFVRWHPPLIAA